MGIDLTDYFLFGSHRRRSWMELYDLLDGLPPWGHYKAAMVMDEEWAVRALDLEAEGMGLPPTGENEENTLTPLYYDPVAARLDLAVDSLMGVRAAIIAVNSQEGREPYFEFRPRPVSAVERERERRVLGELNELDKLLRGMD